MNRSVNNYNLFLNRFISWKLTDSIDSSLSKIPIIMLKYTLIRLLRNLVTDSSFDFLTMHNQRTCLKDNIRTSTPGGIVINRWHLYSDHCSSHLSLDFNCLEYRKVNYGSGHFSSPFIFLQILGGIAFSISHLLK